MNALRGSRSPDPLALLPESAPCGQQNFDLAPAAWQFVSLHVQRIGCETFALDFARTESEHP